MSTWIAFYVKTHDRNSVAGQLRSLTGIEPSEGVFPTNFYDHLLVDEGKPNFILAGSTQPGWVTVIHNSSNKLHDWCQTISKTLDTIVINTIAQSVASYAYFAFYEKGNKVREIEVCYSTDFDEINFGKKFDFETEKQKRDTDEEYEFFLDFDKIQEYCNHFGLNIEEDHNKMQWIIFRGGRKARTVEEFIKGYKKPWWKFW